MTINGIDIEVERKPIKHLHLSVYPPYGRVHVSAPKNVTDEYIRMFILSKWVWLTEKRDAAIKYDVQAPREYVSGEAHYFNGELYRLKVNIEPKTKRGIHIEGNYIVIRCREKQEAKKLMEIWYKNYLTSKLQPLVSKWAEKLKVPEPTFSVRKMKTRWGSCRPESRKITFNLDLAKKPLACIDYVVAHEVTHLIERNHSERFYHLLDMNLPGWEKLRKELNKLPITE